MTTRFAEASARRTETRPSAHGPRGGATHRTAAAVIAAFVLALALATRLPRPLATPGWDGDEGYTFEIAWNLAHGDARMFALEYRFVAHPPLAFAAIAPALRVFGRDLGVVRVGAGVASALSVAMVAWGLARVGRLRAAVLGGLAFAVAPFAVAYGRMGYTYGLLALVVSATIALVVEWRRNYRAPSLSSVPRERLVVAWPIMIAALGPLIDHPGIALPVLVATEVRLATRSWRAGAGTLALALAPAIAFHAAVAWLDPTGSAEEWQQVAARLGASPNPFATVTALMRRAAFFDPLTTPEGTPVPTLATTVALLLANVHGLMRTAWWVPLAVAGLFAIPASAGRTTVLRGFALVAIPAFVVRPIDPWFRTAIPLLPILGWGLGAILDSGVGAAFDVARAIPGRGPLVPRLFGACLGALVLLPLGLEAGATAIALLPRAVTQSLVPPGAPREGGESSGGTAPFTPALALPIDPWLIRDGDDARAAAAWVNARVVPTDLVITSPAVTWLITARVTDHLQATARALPGSPVAFYPATIAPTRWRFEPSVAGARYVILDRITDVWVASDLSTRRVFGPLTDRPPVYRAGAFRVVLGGP
jgi:hypothetical protein